MYSKKVSIIIPVYNVVKYLDKCIESVCAQTEKSIEIILVDDESNDGSIDVCRRWAEKDDRIVLIEQKNAGAGAARNTGLRAAKGEYLLFLNNDMEIITPDFMEKMVSNLQRPQIGAVGAYLDLIPITWTRMSSSEIRGCLIKSMCHRICHLPTESLQTMYSRYL